MTWKITTQPLEGIAELRSRLLTPQSVSRIFSYRHNFSERFNGSTCEFQWTSSTPPTIGWSVHLMCPLRLQVARPDREHLSTTHRAVVCNWSLEPRAGMRSTFLYIEYIYIYIYNWHAWIQRNALKRTSLEQPHKILTQHCSHHLYTISSSSQSSWHHIHTQTVECSSA